MFIHSCVNSTNVNVKQQKMRKNLVRKRISSFIIWSDGLIWNGRNNGTYGFHKVFRQENTIFQFLCLRHDHSRQERVYQSLLLEEPWCHHLWTWVLQRTSSQAGRGSGEVWIYRILRTVPGLCWDSRGLESLTVLSWCWRPSSWDCRGKTGVSWVATRWW